MTTPERTAAAFNLEQIKNGTDDTYKADKSFWQATTMMLDEAANKLLDPTADQAIIQKIKNFHDTYTSLAFRRREVTPDDIDEVNSIIEQTVRALRSNFA